MIDSIFVDWKLLISKACWTVFISLHHSPQLYPKMSLIQRKREIQDLSVLESWPLISTTAAQYLFSLEHMCFYFYLGKMKKQQNLRWCLFQSTKKNIFSLYTSIFIPNRWKKYPPKEIQHELTLKTWAR